MRALRDIGFLESAKRGQITLGVFHIVGPSIASLDEIADIAPFVVDGKYYLVKNFINNTSFFEWDQGTYDSYFKKIKDAVDITIPKLNEMAYEQVELASVPFVTFIANKGPQGEAADLFVRAARLCPALARQCVGGIRPRPAAGTRCLQWSPPRPSPQSLGPSPVPSQVRTGQV